MVNIKAMAHPTRFRLPNNMYDLIGCMRLVMKTGIPDKLPYYKHTKQRYQRLLFHTVAAYFGLVSKSIKVGLTYAFSGFRYYKDKYSTRVEIVDDIRVIVARRECDLPQDLVPAPSKDDRRTYASDYMTAKTRWNLRKKANQYLAWHKGGDYLLRVGIR